MIFWVSEVHDPVLERTHKLKKHFWKPVATVDTGQVLEIETVHVPRLEMGLDVLETACRYFSKWWVMVEFWLPFRIRRYQMNQMPTARHFLIKGCYTFENRSDFSARKKHTWLMYNPFGIFHPKMAPVPPNKLYINLWLSRQPVMEIPVPMQERAAWPMDICRKDQQNGGKMA